MISAVVRFFFISETSNSNVLKYVRITKLSQIKFHENGRNFDKGLTKDQKDFLDTNIANFDD